MTRLGLVLAAGMMLAAGPPAKPTPRQEKLLRERGALWAACRKFLQEGRQAELFAALEKVLQAEREVFGPWHRDTAATAEELANGHQRYGEWAKEAECRRVVVEALRRLDGEDHWRTTEARLELAEALAQPKRPEEQRKALRRARDLNRRVRALSDEGKASMALPLAREALKLLEGVLGRRHPEYAQSLNNLALLHKTMGDHAAALPLFREALQVIEAALGRRHPSSATGLNNLAVLHKTMGDHAAALPLYREALKSREAALGRGHPDFAQSLNNLAALYQEMGDHAAALPLYREALKVYETALGRRHPHYATGLGNLALLHKAVGDHSAALPLLREALKLREAALGRRHPSYATGLNNLAALYQEMGDHAAALTLYREALKLHEAALGRRHPDYATGLNNLALLHQDMGDYNAALPLYREALQVTEAALGRRHPHYVQRLNNLATLHHVMGDHAAALPLYLEALKQCEAALGRRHPHYAQSLNNLAVLHKTMGDHKAALPLYREVLRLREAALGPRHPEYATGLNNLAALHHATGDHKAALPLYREALRLREAALGPRHPDHATGLNNLAVLHQEMGRPGAALPLSEAAMSLTRRQLDLDASVQSERQQREAAVALRYRLNTRLSIPDESAHFSHSHVLSWKGSAFAAQQARRRFVLAQADTATRALALELRDATRSLALLSSGSDAGSRKRTEELIRQKEALEARLAQLSAPFRLAVKPPGSEAFRADLPPGTALIDFLVLTGYDPEKPAKGQAWRRRLVAWVLRADAATLRVDLGLMRHIEEDIASWRGAIEAGRDSPAAARLREALWSPLEKHLDGAKVVLISPDEALGRLPFAALPGREKGKFLLEEVPLAVLPVPRVLAQALAPAKGKPSLLTLGGVEYGDGRGTWEALPGTGPEAAAVVARFRGQLKGEMSSLSGAEATKSALAAALPRHRYAHLATHGYFAPATMKSALGHGDPGKPDLPGREGVSGWDPALLSGLVLAGANTPKLDDDGLLKASEVAEMDLSNVELAVLSACQTGLGKEAGGEGILGLQRAFALAGCKTVVSSLWSVNDAATAVLMERFYHHLWVKKAPRLEALRQAQLDVMRHPEWVEKRVEAMRGTPGLRGIGKSAEVAVAGKKGRRSPIAWWGAWQLSGDWR